MRWLMWLLVIAAIVYAAGVGYLYAEQREMMYHPEQLDRVAPSQYPNMAGVEEVQLHTSDGYEILAWYAAAPTGKPTVVIFHGNGGSLRSERYRIATFKDAGFGVMLLAYRGFSGSEGTPTEDGLYADARAALDWLKGKGVNDDHIVLYGQSLGTGVATKMAVERKVAAVILESPYTSTVDVAKKDLPFVPVDLLMLDRFDSLSRIGDVKEPLLIMHGEKDEVIPQALGHELFDAANEPKEGYWPNLAGHNTIFDLGGGQTAIDFIERTVK